MISENIRITASEGLHARPAAALVKLCSKMNSNIYVKCEGKRCSAKSMVAVLTMGIKKGSLMTIEVDGGDDIKNITSIMAFIKRNING